MRKEFGVLGTVSVREVTWSKVNGWHPHCHELIFFAGDIDEFEYERVARLQWQKSAEQFGLQMNERGFQFDRTFGAVADYVAKFGREPQDTVWSAATEITKSHLKQGRGDEHLTPFGLLERIAQGETEYESVFLEYAQWFKGKHQLVWSAGLRSQLLGNVEALSDEEVAQAAVAEDDNVCLGKLQRSQWNLILKYEARGMLLEVARYGDWTLILDFLYCLETDGLPSPFY
ncbi:hypothetical protein KDH_12080 [Dictyobacter sp. S3.2.2.5]|uniref:Replication protein n=1 Tax=Dictyobacter halimunensis TaxID=3026934 RepID=A0ABQ6FJH9_9CHLR|nr:hypothetical protein KDH_12080 [Dictyobacter sp. S3.2.2.5]